MKQTMILVVIISAVVFHGIDGFGSGAPNYKCDDMLPTHSGIQPENSLPPYTLTANSTTYKPGQNVAITLQSPSGASFAGYILVAKDEATMKTVHGSFVNPDAGKTLDCGASHSGAVTHQNKQGKFLSTFLWQPTADTNGRIIFIATVVQTYTKFWMNIVTAPLSPEVTVPETTEAINIKTTTTQSATTLTPAPRATVPPAGSLTYDKECGDTKGCFVECSGDSCNYIVTWRDNGNVVDFELSTKSDNSNRWIGIGFSSDLNMGEDEVVACLNVGGTTAIERSYNNGNNNIRVTDPSAGLSNKVVLVQDGIFKCSFTKSKTQIRKKRQAARDLFVNLDNDYNVMFGTGPAFTGNFLGSHEEIPKVTPGKVDFQSFQVIGDTAKYPLVKIHACLMIISWIFCTGVAIIAARYYKPVWSKSSLFSQKIWFQIHRTLMVTAMTLTVVAFIIIFVEVGGYSEISAKPGKEYLPSHPVLGIIVTILCVLNPIMSLFRPAPNDSKRPMFNWAHWGVGMVAQILAIITIIFGVELQKSTAPKYTVWVVVGFVIYYVIMDVTQRILDKLADKKSEANVDTVEMKQNGASNGSFTQPPAYSEDNKNKKDTLLKKSLLALHAICTLAFTLTLLLLVAMY